MNAHKTAIVSDGANVAGGVTIGAYSIIEEGVSIGKDTIIGPHVLIKKGTKIGEACKLHIGVVVGDEPQDLAFTGNESSVEIGDRNTLRE